MSTRINHSKTGHAALRSCVWLRDNFNANNSPDVGSLPKAGVKNNKKTQTVYNRH